MFCRFVVGRGWVCFLGGAVCGFLLLFYVGFDVVSLVIVVVVLNDVVSGRVSLVTVAVVLFDVDGIGGASIVKVAVVLFNVVVSGGIFVIVDVSV